MTIIYGSEDAFYEGIHQLVTKGLMFKALHHKLTIELTGGH